MARTIFRCGKCKQMFESDWFDHEKGWCKICVKDIHKPWDKGRAKGQAWEKCGHCGAYNVLHHPKGFDICGWCGKEQFMTVEEIVKKYLKDNEFEGLFNDELLEGCACEIADLMPCGEDFSQECKAGYRTPCDCEGDHAFHISAGRVTKEVPTPLEIRRCRVCGCTDEDCSQCLAETGVACHWVEEDLCSRCEGETK